MSEGVWSSVSVVESSSDVGEDRNGEDSRCVFGFEVQRRTVTWGMVSVGVIAEVTTVDDCFCVEGEER